MLQVEQPTEEQTQQQKLNQESAHKSVSDKLKNDPIQQEILKDLGLSPDAGKKVEDKVKNKEESVQEEEVQSKEEEVVEEEENSEDVQEEDSDDEEVIPKSKIQPRIDKLTAQIKAQQKELDEMRTARENASEQAKDEVTKQLDGMTPEQLKAAKLEVRKAQIRSQGDEAKLNELIELEDKIDTVISNAPQNFAKAQQKAYSDMANKIAASGDIPDLEKASPQIIKMANEIYAQYPLLQKDVKGQAVALELAVNHYKLLSSIPGDKTKETELKRQVNTLKRKTTLDTKSNKSNSDQVKLDTLRKNAMNGSMQHKVALIRSHPAFNVDGMIPDEFKEK